MGGFTPGGRYIDWGVDIALASSPRQGGGFDMAINGRTTIRPVEFTPPDRFDTCSCFRRRRAFLRVEPSTCSRIPASG
jgi:hypothetical protein